MSPIFEQFTRAVRRWRSCALLASLVLFAGASCQRNDGKRSTAGRGPDEATPLADSWTLRHPPLLAYDPSFGPNAQRVRLNAPLQEWAAVGTAQFASAEECEGARLEQYSREYGRRAVSLRLYLNAVNRGGTTEVDVLEHKVAADSGHDDQLENARCINSGDARLSQPGRSPNSSMYLLVPPVEPDIGEDIRSVAKAIPIHLRVRFDAPLGRWYQFGAFDSAAVCEAGRHARLAQVGAQAEQRPNENFSEPAAHLAAARCVSTADQNLTRIR
jgi:hypothetical protein